MIAAWFIYDGRNPLGFGWQSIGTSNLDCFGSFIPASRMSILSGLWGWFTLPGLCLGLILFGGGKPFP